MLGKKKSLADAVLELNVYSQDLSAINAPNHIRIYVVSIDDKRKRINALVMVDNKFIGYRALKTNWTLQVCDIQVEDIFDVYKYFNGKKTYNLSLIDADGIEIIYGNVRKTIYRVDNRNEGEKLICQQKRTRPKSNGIVYNSNKHAKLINFIISNNVKKK